MCIPGLFGQKDSGAAAQLALAQKQQEQSAAAVAQANMDTESSRVAAESQLRRAAAAQGFASTILGGASGNQTPSGSKMLFGQ